MKAVYYISKNRAWGHVATQVWDIFIRKLGKEFQIPIYKHQKLRVPQELEGKTI